MRRQRRGQRATNDDPERNHIVLGDPFAEREHPVAEQRRDVGQTCNALRRDTDCRRGHTDDDADLAPAMKWNDNAHAGPRAVSVRVVDLVREVAEKRKREGDGDEHGRKLPHRPLSGHRWPMSGGG